MKPVGVIAISLFAIGAFVCAMDGNIPACVADISCIYFIAINKRFWKI